MSTQTSYENGQLRVTRLYNAPREAVFKAWIETSKVQKWWGCGDTTKVKSDIEAKLGGKYVHIMTIKDAGEHPVNGVITEYDPPSLLAYEAPSPVAGEIMTVRVEFIARGSDTEVRLTHNNIPTTMGDIVSAGWSAAFDKLKQFLLDDASAA